MQLQRSVTVPRGAARAAGCAVVKGSPAGVCSLAADPLVEVDRGPVPRCDQLSSVRRGARRPPHAAAPAGTGHQEPIGYSYQ